MSEKQIRPRFGPQTEHVEAVLARAKAVTTDDVERLTNARPGRWDASWDIAASAAYHAALDAGRSEELVTAGRIAERVAWNVVRGLVVRDLIGGLGFTQEHYDTLTGPWRRVVGRVHPGDPHLTDRPTQPSPTRSETQL